MAQVINLCQGPLGLAKATSSRQVIQGMFYVVAGPTTTYSWGAKHRSDRFWNYFQHLVRDLTFLRTTETEPEERVLLPRRENQSLEGIRIPVRATSHHRPISRSCKIAIMKSWHLALRWYNIVVITCSWKGFKVRAVRVSKF